MPAIIYSLIDPRSGAVRYIGKATDLHMRLWQHLADARKGCATYRSKWIRSLVMVGVTPVASPIYSVPEDAEWKCAERFFIASARYLGLRITNTTDGGDSGPLPQVRERISESTRATWADPSIRSRRVAAMKAYFADPENRAKRAAVLHLPEIRAARAAEAATEQSRERKRSNALQPDVRSKKSAAMLRLFADPIWKQRHDDALREGFKRRAENRLTNKL